MKSRHLNLGFGFLTDKLSKIYLSQELFLVVEPRFRVFKVTGF